MSSAVPQPASAPGATTSPPGRRERRKQEVRQRVLDAAIALGVERGWDTTTMDAIADRADVARATVFNHFPKKDDVVQAWTERREAEAQAHLAAGRIPTTDLTVELGATHDRLADFNERSWSESRAYAVAWAQSSTPLSLEPLVSEVYIPILERHGDELRPGLDLGDAARVLRACYFDALARWVEGDEAQTGPAFSLRAALRSAQEIVLGGIKAP
ncbi:MAG TPA: TetR/AcrR family transcriptional regulator [Iamia sp.]|nr:TetR/AcrR family transcriptional regulator [Iamia sp.]